VMRGVLIEDSLWEAAERSLYLQDLQAAQKLVVCNALRGVLPAQLLTQSQLQPHEVSAA